MRWLPHRLEPMRSRDRTRSRQETCETRLGACLTYGGPQWATAARDDELAMEYGRQILVLKLLRPDTRFPPARYVMRLS
jgi:hypothetical protein